MFISNDVYDDVEDDVHDDNDDVLDVQSLVLDVEEVHNNHYEQQESLLHDKRSIDNPLSSPFLKVLYS